MSQNSNENLSSIEANGEPSTDQSQSSITTTASIASSSPATSLQSLSLATSIDEKNEKLKIILDNPDHTYYSGQTIRGTITLNCKQKKKIRGKLKSIVDFSSSSFCFECVCKFVSMKKNIVSFFGRPKKWVIYLVKMT